jgi:hypothetical protein
MEDDYKYAIYVSRDDKRVLIPFSKEAMYKIMDKSDIVTHMVIMYKETSYPVNVNLN